MEEHGEWYQKLGELGMIEINTQSIMQTGALALVTAYFVDTALIQLASSRIRLNLKRRLIPSVVKIYAALDYRYIENNDMGTHDELLSRPGKYADMWASQAQWYEREEKQL